MNLMKKKEINWMKPIKTIIRLLAIASLLMWLATPAMAFHDGGVAYCNGCHTMHNSENGQSIIPGGVPGVTGDSLTKGADPSSTCLNCHSGSGSYHVFSTTGGNLTPGGDFYWLTKTLTFPSRPGSTTMKTRNGRNCGHNIVAADFGLVADSDLTQAPGGTFPSAQLACSSCHDPHGKIANNTRQIMGSGSYGDPTPAQGVLGNYRLLGDVGYRPAPTTTFTNPAPTATTARTSAANETNSNHTDYGRGMSEWCSNCHTGFIAAGVGAHRHPASNTATLGSNLSTNYNMYVRSGDLTGTSATAYLALVPFERQISDRTQLSSTTTAGASSSSNAMCLSCHRAHASAFTNAGRWDFEVQFLVDSHPQTTDTGAIATDQLNSYYGRDVAAVFGTGQRSLCNKCHIQD